MSVQREKRLIGATLHVRRATVGLRAVRRSVQVHRLAGTRFRVEVFTSERRVRVDASLPHVRRVVIVRGVAAHRTHIKVGLATRDVVHLWQTPDRTVYNRCDLHGLTALPAGSYALGRSDTVRCPVCSGQEEIMRRRASKQAGLPLFCWAPAPRDDTRAALLQARATGRCRICGGEAIGVTCGREECLRRWLILPALGVGADD